MRKFIVVLGLFACTCAILMSSVPVIAQGGGSGGSGVDTIKVSKCFYVASNATMLINAVSSRSTAHLYVYLPSGAYLGEVQNGGGGKYGGSVFYVGPDPVFITIVSSSGGSTSAPTVPYQP